LKRATIIITVSNSTQQDAHQLVGIPIQRMRTVYSCIDERFLNVMEEEKVQAFRQQKGLTEGFLLYLGTLEPRKNLTTLIDAYTLLRQRYGVREKLVLAGGTGWLYDTIFEKVRRYGLESEVIFPGYVADEEQVLWYSAASTFVYPSLYEGFGMPVTEGLACGIPVVTSNVSSLPEAGATFALTVNPNDRDALAEALYQSLTDSAYRERCRASAPLVKQQFSAQKMAEQTIAVYEQAAALHTVRNRSQRISFV
jgi:glycosyltransferase involved in cell wall biosynthesis